MPPKIANLKRIANDKTRMTTYKKRKACLYRKADELSTLCGVETCLIVYGPTKATDEVIAEPEIWPRDESKVRDIIGRYKATESNTCRKETHIETFVNDIGKEEKERDNNKIVKKNKKCSLEEKLANCSQEELRNILLGVDVKLNEAMMRQNHIMNRIQYETQNFNSFMAQQYLPEQQTQQLVWPDMGFSYNRSHGDEMQMEPNGMENWNQNLMMQRYGPYHNVVEPGLHMHPGFGYNPVGYPGGFGRRFQPPHHQLNELGQLLEKK